MSSPDSPNHRTRVSHASVAAAPWPNTVCLSARVGGAGKTEVSISNQEWMAKHPSTDLLTYLSISTGIAIAMIPIALSIPNINHN